MIKWYVGAQNDCLFIINKQPALNNDEPWHDNPNGATMALNVDGLTVKQAQAICDAHNSAKG